MAALAAIALASSGALAEQYDVPILIDNEQDLLDLLENEDISESEYDILVELFQRRVLINTASRDELFELPGMTYPIADAVVRARRDRDGFANQTELAEVDGLPHEVLDQIAPFLEYDIPAEDDPGEPFELGLGGQARLKVLEVFGDGDAPSMYTRVRLHALDRRLRVGWVGMLRTTPGELQGPYTDGLDAPDPWFVAEAPSWGFEAIPKLYASWRDEIAPDLRVHAVAGSFNAGFGERLVLDTTNRRRPYGLYEDDLIYDSVGGTGSLNAGFRRHRGLFGGAVQLTGLGGREVWADVTLLGSHATHDEFTNFFNPSRTYYSYEEGLDGEDDCGATNDDRCHPPDTFPDARTTTLFGGNARLHIGGNGHIGFTAYAGSHAFTTGDAVIDFSPSASTPVRRSYWALGPEFALSVGDLNLFAELAFTDLGGVGAVARSLVDLDDWALEVSGRYYGDTFDNPFGRGEASATQLLGRRNRDEAGGRMRLVGSPTRALRLLTTIDLYRLLTRQRTDLQAFVRGDYEISTLRRNDLRLSAWVKYTDRDLGAGGRGEDYNNPGIPASAGPDYPPDLGHREDPDLIALDLYLDALFDESTGLWRLARGLRFDVGGQVIFRPLDGMTITAYGRYSLRDALGADGFYDDRFQRSLSTWFRFAWRFDPRFDLSTRARYYREEMDRDAGPGYLDFYLRAGFSWPKLLRGSLRYDLRSFVTGDRGDDNEIEHLVRFVVDVTF